MAKRTRITLLVGLFLLIQLFLISLILHRESVYIATVTQLHATEQKLSQLTIERTQLLHQLHHKQNRSVLATEAHKKGMVPLSLDRVRTLS